MGVCRKARWSLAEDWAPCALGMLPSPHHPCGRMPSLDIAPCQYPRELADAEAADPVTETLQQPAANAIAAKLGTGPALTNGTSTKASRHLQTIYERLYTVVHDIS